MVLEQDAAGRPISSNVANCGRRCVVDGCSNGGAGPHKILHVIPAPSRKTQRDIWVSSLGLDESKVTRNTVVCNAHFKPEDYESKLEMSEDGSFKKVYTKRLRADAVPSPCHPTDQKTSSSLVKPTSFKVIRVVRLDSTRVPGQQTGHVPVAASVLLQQMCKKEKEVQNTPTCSKNSFNGQGCQKKPGTVKVAIEITGKQPAKQAKRQKYPKNSKRKLSKCSRSTIVVKQPQSSVTIKLSGKVAEDWKREQEDWTDAGFIQYLLLMRKKYEQLKENCTCGCEEIVRKEPDIEAEQCGIEDDEDVELSDDSGDEQPCKDDKDWLETDEGIETVTAQSVSSDEYDMSECSDVDYEPDGKRIKKKKPLFEENNECWVCDHVTEKITQKKPHVMAEHCVLYIDCKKCDEKPPVDEYCLRKITPDTVKLDDYLTHLQTAHGITDYECPFCSHVKLQDPESYRQHVFTKHTKDLLCQCKLCMESDSADTGNHILKSSSLRHHMLVKHCDKEGTCAQKIPCNICGMPVKAINMQTHVRKQHGEKKPSTLCDLCGKYFSHLAQHKLNVHKPRDHWKFQCTKCDKRFANKWNLQTHFRLHTGEKPYICDICGKSFRQNVELRLHTENNHGAPKKNQRSGKRKKEQDNGLTVNNPEPGATQQHDLNNKNGQHPGTHGLKRYVTQFDGVGDQSLVSDQTIVAHDQVSVSGCDRQGEYSTVAGIPGEAPSHEWVHGPPASSIAENMNSANHCLSVGSGDVATCLAGIFE